MEKLLKEIINRAKKTKEVIVFPEGDDRRILNAVKIIEKERIAKTIVLKKGNLDYRLKEGVDLLLKNKADGMITGATHSTLLTLKYAFHFIGTKKDVKKSSGAFLMLKEDKGFLFADCAAIISPTSEELAEIAKLSAETFEFLTGKKARVAMLSYSTKGSGKGESVDRVRRGVEIAKKFGISVDGEMQADSALIKDVFEKKYKNSKFKGEANVLIFPDLNSGNISYKLVERLGNYRAIGPVMQGLKKPVNDLSRGCSVQDIVNLCAITVLQNSFKKSVHGKDY